MVENKITLPVEDLPAGRYPLQVGLYDPETGEHLAAEEGIL